MYPPPKKDFIALTLSDPHSHAYNNGKHRRQSCWRVSGPVVQYAHNNCVESLPGWITESLFDPCQIHTRLHMQFTAMLWSAYVGQCILFSGVPIYLVELCSWIKFSIVEHVMFVIYNICIFFVVFGKCPFLCQNNILVTLHHLKSELLLCSHSQSHSKSFYLLLIINVVLII